MVKVKMMAKPKGKGSSQGTSTGGYYGGVAEADYATQAGKAKRAEHAESADTAERANSAAYASRATYAQEAGQLSEDAEVLRRFLDKTTEEAQEVLGEVTLRSLVTLAQGLVADGVAKLRQGASLGDGTYSLDKDGNVVVSSVRSEAFDEALQRGFGITRNARGKYTLGVTDLLVWGKAVFESLEIRKLYSVGGNVYLSGASSRLQHVTPVYAEDGKTLAGWKCHVLADDGTTATQNGWRRYDQARCQTFNINEGTYQNVQNRHYWRLVTDVSQENEEIADSEGRTLYEGKKFAWIVLSATDCEDTETNDAPAAGDTIVLDGHRMFASDDERAEYNDEGRTNVMTLETTGATDGTLPRIVALSGITDYRHGGSTEETKYDNTVFILSPREVIFVTSRVRFIGRDGGTVRTVNFRGEWRQGEKYWYYDQVSHLNAMWTCLAEGGDEPTSSEPSDGNALWRKELHGVVGEKGEKGDPGDDGEDAYSVVITTDRGNVILNGEGTRTLFAHVYRGAEEITATLPADRFSWRRTSGDTAADTAWNRRHEGIGNAIMVGKEDIDRSALFDCDVVVELDTIQ